MTKSVWLLVPGTGGGGAEFVATEWANWLAASGYAVSIVATNKPDRGRVSEEIPIRHVRQRGFLRRVRAVRALVTRHQPDVVVALMPHWNVLALASVIGLRRSRPRVIISGRNVESSLTTVHGLRFRIETRLARLLYRHADAYVAISHPVAAEAAEKYRLHASRLWVVPNPAVAKVSQGGVIGGARPATPTSGSSIRLLVPARLVAQKRPLLAIDVAACLQDHHALDASVHYFGAGPLEGAVARHADSVGVAAEFHGWHETWFDEACLGDVVLLPSLAEGFANVLVEAAAVGLPSVVSSRALGSADAILPGITGYFAREDSPQEFARAVLRAKDLSITGIDKWLEYFSAPESGEALIQVIESLGNNGD